MTENDLNKTCKSCKDKVSETQYYICTKYKWKILKKLGKEQEVCGID